MQSPNPTLPYNNPSGRLFRQNHHQERVDPALERSNQGLPSCEPQDYPDGRFPHNHLPLPVNIQGQHQYSQRQGPQPQSYSTLIPQLEFSSTQHYQGRVDQGPILQPQYQKESKPRPQPPYQTQPLPQSSQFGFEQSYTGGNRQVFQPPHTTLTTQGQFQSLQQYHSRDRQASQPQHSSERNQTQRQLSSERLRPEQPFENIQQYRAQRGPCEILNGYESFSYPEHENHLGSLESPRPTFAQHNHLSQSSLGDRFIRQKDSNRNPKSLSRQSSIEKRKRVDKDTTFWKALFSLGRKKSGQLALSGGPKYQPAPGPFVSDRFASHLSAGIYPKGPVSTAHLEKVLNDQEELLQSRKRASQSSARISIPQKRIGTTQRLVSSQLALLGPISSRRLLTENS